MDLLKWNDVDVTPHYVRDEAEPYSLPIVVRVERNTEYSDEDAYMAVSALMVSLFSSDKWEDTLTLWMQGRIRKVVRKARASAWEQAKTLDHLYVKVNNVEMMVFEPHLLEDLHPLLKKMQVQGIDFSPMANYGVPSKGTLKVSVNPDLVMSTGKTLAQVAHGVQVFILSAPKSEVETWVASGCKTVIVSWNDFGNPVVIQDAGFTEIPAGSVTVKAELSK